MNDAPAPVLELHFRSKAEQLQQVRCSVRGAVERLGFAADDVNCIVLAVNEACMNIIQHAYGVTTEGDVILEVFDEPDAAVFRLTDFAAPINKACIKSRDLNDLRPGGLGVHLMNQVMDEVDFRNDPEGIGNTLLMKRRKHR